MNKAGKSVLFFLAGCMAFINAVIGTLTKISPNLTGIEILNYSFLSLLLVLLSLVLMYFKDPSFLLAQKDDVISLVLLKEIGRMKDVNLMKHAINQFTNSPSTEENNEIDEEETSLVLSEEGISGDEIDE